MIDFFFTLLYMFHKSQYTLLNTVSKLPNSKQCHYIYEAEKIAQKSTVVKKHGCVIVQNNKIIARGYNKHMSIGSIVSKKFKPNDPFHPFSTIHAEVDALNQIKKKNIKLDNAQMYVVRIPNHICTFCGTQHDFLLSMPCDNCRNYINKFPGISKVYFTTQDSITSQD